MSNLPGRHKSLCHRHDINYSFLSGVRLLLKGRSCSLALNDSCAVQCLTIQTSPIPVSNKQTVSLLKELMKDNFRNRHRNQPLDFLQRYMLIITVILST